MPKPIVTDTYDFPTLIRRGYVYVDKTALLHRLISGVDGLMFFLSRPRRFGKSLMISTLDQIFRGNRELFKGLAIAKMDYDWTRYPVIRLDMSSVRANVIDEYRRLLCEVVAAEAVRHRLTLDEKVQPGWMLGQLIEKLARRGRKVVVLVDEYDAPLSGLLGDPKMLAAVQGLLHDFYVTLKVRVADIHFLMMTGVSKFSKLSVFSGLNNLTDLSMNGHYAELLGYTPSELRRFFAPHLKAFAKANGIGERRAVAELLDWYDSYRFSPESAACVCNPVSIGCALSRGKIGSYWSRTGNATLIIERLRKAKKLPIDLEGFEASVDSLEFCDAKSLPFATLMYQGGYLTIKSVRPDGRLILGIPNREVALSLGSGFLTALTEDPTDDFVSAVQDLRKHLEDGVMTDEGLARLLTAVFAMVPHEWKLGNESEAKRYFLLFMKMAGADIAAEVESSKGRADAVVKTEKAIYVLEFKYGKSARAALQQVVAQGYAKPYVDDGRAIVGVGVNYNPNAHEVAIAREVVKRFGEVVNSTGEVVNSIDEVVNETIRANPGCRKPKLLLLIRTSRATLERSLARLASAGRVEFRGASKTGGYYIHEG